DRPRQAGRTCQAGERAIVRAAACLVVVGITDDGGEQEEGETRGQEQVADRSDVPDVRHRNREEVRERAGVAEEVDVEKRGQRRVERRRGGGEGEAGGLEA